jgi:hypothetical protein
MVNAFDENTWHERKNRSLSTDDGALGSTEL